MLLLPVIPPSKSNMLLHSFYPHDPMTPLIWFGIAWLLGIILADSLHVPNVLFVSLVLPALSAMILYRHEPRIKQSAMFGLALCLGGLWLNTFQPTIDQNYIAYYNDQPDWVTVVGTVVDEPDMRDYHINLRVWVESIQFDDLSKVIRLKEAMNEDAGVSNTLPPSVPPARGEASSPSLWEGVRGRAKPTEGLLLVRAPRYPERFYGDKLALHGLLETPPEFEDFSYKDYLARFGIHAMMHRPRVELLAAEQANPFWASMYAFKRRASQTINQILPEPQASLLNGILLGIETGIPRDLYDLFNLTGTSHIIVISGSNIALVAAILLLLGQYLFGKRHAPLIAMVGIVLYTLLVGADAAVSRAALMGGLWVFSIWIGRPGMALNTLFAAAIALTLFNPLIVWDVGFQLSFLATMGLIVLVPPLQENTFRLLRRRLHWRRLGLTMALLSELLLITLAAQIITGPLIVYHFGRFSLVSLLTNLLILPAQPPIMLLGALATGTGMLWLPLGQLLGGLVWLPLAWTVWIVETTAQWPYASLDVGRLPVWLMLILYLTIAGGVWWLKRPSDDVPMSGRFHLPTIGSLKTRLMLGGALTIALLIWLVVLSMPDGYLHVAFLDVGQGDAILVTLPDGRQMLIDGGPSATMLNWRLGQELPFWDKSLDLLISTHSDMDHLGGLVDLLDRYTVEQVLETDVVGDSALYRAWQTQLETHQLKPTVGQAGQVLSLGQGVTATILNPGQASAGESAPNQHSIVLRLEMGTVSFLLTGDIEQEVEQKLLWGDAPLSATVLKSPHHGSFTSSSEPFLEAVEPRIVVIQVGSDNRFGHPRPEVLERYAARGITVLRTDERGTIELITDGQRLWLETAH
ncbi:DNA internalization-related competence protein ComEC/Rec2 [Anaerolineales bacterium HSG6]|nr:DNA internalization-related competence protein ComEC/Rec2 [Anaerolineales bacterium HSG6]